ncbi:MAG: hypothetical protein NTX52_02190 [Planctomycetota bacterium]|nr:hypothetical protein [Planctomycetota bacterium]
MGDLRRRGEVDGLMLDSAPPTAGKLRRINPPYGASDKPRYSWMSECVNAPENMEKVLCGCPENATISA